MKVRYKKSNPSIPDLRYATEGAACFDFTAVQVIHDGDHNFSEYRTGISVEIPEGHVGLLFPRSSNTKKDLILGNSVGVIDSDYRGEIVFRYKDISKDGGLHWIPSRGWESQNDYVVGDRIGQMMIIPLPKIELELVEELSETVRGIGAFGSTGK